MNVVLDTNVLVSALWSADGKPGIIVNSVIARQHTLCYDYRILEEYVTVLMRPKFKFEKSEIDRMLEPMIRNGMSVISDRINIDFIDESDKKFYEVAKFCDAYLVTCNLRHYPNENKIISVADFCSLIM